MTDYHSDFYSWTKEQANLLQSGLFSEVDIEHLLEELFDMAGNKRRELKSRLAVLIAHLLKCYYQPEKGGRSWLLTIKEQRLEINDVLEENPGLKPELPEQLRKAYRLAILQASRETKLSLNIFPEVCPWTFEQIIADDFLPI